MARVARRVAQRPWVMRAKPAILRMELGVRRISKGRRGILDVAGLPSVRITVPGRKTGVPRTTSLLAVPEPERFLVVGSNWGSAKHPVWSANLRAAETAEVCYRGECGAATVTEITGVERKRAWDQAVEFWPGYRMEEELSGGRHFRIFELRPA
ncbi:nitroreductase family deazaflavin-dependent oxidoreductase [Nocardia sp. NPDC050712]|uniref:nitroreductase family deazaflavin-dependent oxidoreductase n=1 Tax=Nocardia sp. NPDC050712 TaxID=3155518 RepID=UPI0033C0E0ED